MKHVSEETDSFNNVLQGKLSPEQQAEYESLKAEFEKQFNCCITLPKVTK